MPKCDYGNPCNCYECSNTSYIKECSYCKEPPIKIIRELTTDRKGMTDYENIAYFINHIDKIKIKIKL